jgi:hypothetical protein
MWSSVPSTVSPVLLLGRNAVMRAAATRAMLTTPTLNPAMVRYTSHCIVIRSTGGVSHFVMLRIATGYACTPVVLHIEVICISHCNHLCFTLQLAMLHIATSYSSRRNRLSVTLQPVVFHIAIQPVVFHIALQPVVRFTLQWPARPSVPRVTSTAAEVVTQLVARVATTSTNILSSASVSF